VSLRVMPNLKVTVLTAEETIFEGEVEKASLPASPGEVTILTGHAPWMGILNDGVVDLGSKGEFVIAGGFAKVYENNLVVLADSASDKDKISESIAQAQKKAAEDKLKEQDIDRVEFAKAEAALRKSLAELKYLRRRTRHTH